MRYYTDVKRHSRHILVTGYDNHKRFRDKIEFAPSLYVKSPKDEEYKTIYGDNLSKLDFHTMYEASDFIKKYKDVANFEIFGNDKFDNNYIATEFPDDKVAYEFDDISISYIDIETTTEYGNINIQDTPEEITLITIANSKSGVITFGSRPYNGDKDINYVLCPNESSLLKRFTEYWANNYPDVISGWNTEFFDIPYLVRRIAKILGDDYVKVLSPWRIVNERTKQNNNKDVLVYEIYGIQHLDYFALYRKFRLIPRESYKLDNIAYCEINAQKLKNPADTFKEFYTDHWDMFVEYNIIDVDLVVRLEDKLRLIEVALTMAYSSHVNYEDVFSPVRVWESIINSYLLSTNVIQPLRNSDSVSQQYAGAYVKEPQRGMQNWVCSFDATSLYPSIIMGYNISTETLVDERLDVDVDKLVSKEYSFDGDYCVAANGTQYRKDKHGFLAILMRKFFNDRVIFKTKMLDAKKQLECLERELLRRKNES